LNAFSLGKFPPSNQDKSAVSQIEIFVDEQSGVESVGLALIDASIVEHEDELVPGCTVTPFQARCMAAALIEMAERIEGVGV
jgi:hypothetical protein